MGACCSDKKNISTNKTNPTNRANKKIISADQDNSLIALSSNRKCSSPKSKKKERPSPEIMSRNYNILSKQSTLLQDSFLQQANQVQKTFKPLEKKLKDYILLPPEEYMLCKICNDILFHPKLCSKCNAFLCSHCFDNTQSVCDHVIASKLDSYYNTIIEVLEGEEFKCFNTLLGCTRGVSYKKLTYDKKTNRYNSTHDQQCVHKIEKCYNPNCTFQGGHKDFLIHICRCQYTKFKCYFCKDIFNRSEKESHSCFGSKQCVFSLPIRYCKCHSELQWIIRDDNDDDNYKSLRTKCYYKCLECDEMKNEREAPVPISKVCGCFTKLTGGIIAQCSTCGVDGGIGWSCNSCGNRVGLCELCLQDKMEINMNTLH